MSYLTAGLWDSRGNVVNSGGDADTTGAIAGMLAGAVYGREAIPESWLKTLNADTRRSCERQAAELGKGSYGAGQG